MSRKQPKNLLLDATAIERGERYARRHRTNLSALVSDYLRALPVDAPSVVRSPAVHRLYGAAARVRTRKPDYHDYLARKYGVD
jgi:hypothetical protein